MFLTISHLQFTSAIGPASDRVIWRERESPCAWMKLAELFTMTVMSLSQRNGPPTAAVLAPQPSFLLAFAIQRLWKHNFVGLQKNDVNTSVSHQSMQEFIRKQWQRSTPTTSTSTSPKYTFFFSTNIYFFFFDKNFFFSEIFLPEDLSHKIFAQPFSPFFCAVFARTMMKDWRDASAGEQQVVHTSSSRLHGGLGVKDCCHNNSNPGHTSRFQVFCIQSFSF